ncbi:fluoride efflux transporter CrcB [Streptomyces aureocirculatus]|uniref:fluoride efflux transporter CrcB n=1 Tax=Streptomyces aureocirculatus TaxID=67275 RepID=UPI0004C78AF8|nr:fluoride efflux transporter CrcB [Streptomyces aureocirculatus]
MSTEPGRHPALLRGQGHVLAVVAIGGALGAAARYGAALIWPVAAGGFPWTTFAVNAVGCAAIGVLMVLVTDVTPESGPAHPLLRPFLGTGVLGGFTTFSTYTVDVERLADAGHVRTGLAYLALTLLAALAAVWCATAVTRRAVARRRPCPGEVR